MAMKLFEHPETGHQAEIRSCALGDILLVDLVRLVENEIRVTDRVYGGLESARVSDCKDRKVSYGDSARVVSHIVPDDAVVDIDAPDEPTEDRVGINRALNIEEDSLFDRIVHNSIRIEEKDYQSGRFAFNHLIWLI